ncbi:MAG: hypothetical protein SVJ22_04620 [Halobacteriota archaeon]|nr:hypothetical protein [Halobacteriota archaeon]
MVKTFEGQLEKETKAAQKSLKSLLIYSIAKWKLREGLKETGDTVPDQKIKPTGRPTMKWVFYLFRGVSEVVRSETRLIAKWQIWKRFC